MCEIKPISSAAEVPTIKAVSVPALVHNDIVQASAWHSCEVLETYLESVLKKHCPEAIYSSSSAFFWYESGQRCEGGASRKIRH